MFIRIFMMFLIGFYEFDWIILLFRVRREIY